MFAAIQAVAEDEWLTRSRLRSGSTSIHHKGFRSPSAILSSPTWLGAFTSLGESSRRRHPLIDKTLPGLILWRRIALAETCRQDMRWVQILSRAEAAPASSHGNRYGRNPLCNQPVRQHFLQETRRPKHRFLARGHLLNACRWSEACSRQYFTIPDFQRNIGTPEPLRIGS